MTELKNYLQDGANHQSRAVLMYLQIYNIENSWSDERKEYKESPLIARWENCREQGYVISIRSKKRNQLNIAFFEHRNSDEIHAVKWEQDSMNSLTISSAIFKDVYENKWSTSYSVKHGEVTNMSDWICKELDYYYDND